jgi:hypothetical protein
MQRVALVGGGARGENCDAPHWQFFAIVDYQ